MNYLLRQPARVLALVLMLACTAIMAFGQAETGQIIGTVTDQTGAVVPGAKLDLRSVETGAGRTAISNPSGVYSFAGLQPGKYEVSVSAQGFAPAKHTVEINVGSKNTVDIAMKVGGSETVMEVAGAGAVAVETQTQEMSNVVTERQVTELPTLTRNPYDLVGTAGNVSGGTPTQQTANYGVRGVGYAINGQRPSSTSILMDGGENVNLFDTTVGQSIPLDAVEEFRVVTSNFGAEYGRATGGVVNVATKRGGNDFHGSLYEFNRVSKLASNTYANSALAWQSVQDGVCKDTSDPACPGAKARFTRNQFGYSFGGPIKKDKLFFFSSTEWVRVRSIATLQAWVPTPEFINASGDATKNFFNAYGGDLAGSFAKVVMKADVAGSIPLNEGGKFSALPDNLPIFGLVNYALPGDSGGGLPSDRYFMLHRLDWNASDKTQLFGRYALQSENYFDGTNAYSPYKPYNTGTTYFNNNGMVGLTRVISPNMVSISKIVFNRLTNMQPLGSKFGPALYLTANGGASLDGYGIAMPGYLPFSPGNAIPFGGPQNLYQFYQDFNWTKGTHQFRFGGQFIQTRDNRMFGAYETSVESLGPNGDPATGLDNFVSGVLHQFEGAVFPQGKYPCKYDASGSMIPTPDCTLNLPVGAPSFSRSNRYNDLAFYFTDSWKVAHNLSLTLGLRWEYYGVQHNNNPDLDSNFYFGNGTGRAEQIRNGAVMLAPDSPVGGLWQKDRNNFGPRVGFAWDVLGDGKTSLRGGYGLSYERNFGNVTFNAIQNPPNYAVVALISGSDVPVGSMPISVDNAGPLAGSGGTKPLPRVSLRHLDEKMVNPYTHFWNMSLERQLTNNTVVEAGYTGSRGLKQYAISNINVAGAGNIFFGDTTVNSRLNPQYGNINTRNNDGDSYYHAFNLGVRSNNLWKALTLSANYTWAHNIDDLSSTFGDSNNNLNMGLLNPFHAGLDRGNSDLDIRHRFVLSANWEIPWMKNAQNSLARHVLGGWQIAPIFTAQTGLPFTIFDYSNTAWNGLRYTPTAPVQYSSNKFQNIGVNDFVYLTVPAGQWVEGTNPNFQCNQSYDDAGELVSFSNCADFGPYPKGMSARNAFRGPGFWNIDLGIYKNFKITERVKVQFRGELFNAVNHHNYYIQGSNTYSDTNGPFTINAVKGSPYGYPSASDERRNVQLGLKILF
jgi:outer membrane receptor protein involved in Fe transport